ncbi:MAG: hypothetical protein ACRCX8_18795 [Sarcina sp.]
MAKNIKTNTAEYKVSGILNVDDKEDLKVEYDGVKVSISEILEEFNGMDVEFAFKQKTEIPLGVEE